MADLPPVAAPAALYAIARRRPQEHVGRVHHAPQRLGHCGHRGVARGVDAYRVHRGDRDVLREPARQAGDAMFAISLALMRVPAGAVLARGRPPLAHTAPALIDHDPIPGAEVSNGRARLFHDSRNFVTEDLRLAGEGDGPSALVAVVVGVTGEDVQVRAAQPDRLDTHQDFPGPGTRARDISDVYLTHVYENCGFHRLGPPKPPEPPPTSPTCIS